MPIVSFILNVSVKTVRAQMYLFIQRAYLITAYILNNLSFRHSPVYFFLNASVIIFDQVLRWHDSSQLPRWNEFMHNICFAS